MNKNILIWIIATFSLVPSVLAQTGLFGNSGAPFLTVGIIIIIIFLIVDQLRRSMKS